MDRLASPGIDEGYPIGIVLYLSDAANKAFGDVFWKESMEHRCRVPPLYFCRTDHLHNV